ncbi:benzoylformate decarboxylase/acetolactate synthase-1/2/3 large subunit [Noviherbaspirillum humi]|uniref:Benzoylformate decarboxylase/acetolactate synthase-1/2/3 large subunit n=1 Tax=Noviherbaspirillum humi TaxID=1688639 RepID=A0A239IL95_9BURK|nr:thiamine pyrophosphate-dependent enzyme [Noviherbaspirillum humi]SNS94440.1 benzoylformate decarboxylase/acetolactate synthase-1/2/3 large subunit [Noviherbaspirillum humi]
MSEENDKPGIGMDRRNFLKSAAITAGAATAGAMATGAVQAQAADAKPGAAPKKADRPYDEKLIPRPGSDFMVDVIKSLNISYIAANPGSSFRSLHESVVNYGGNSKPELITCMHEEASVAIAHGYAKAAGKPMAVMLHGTVGLQHAAMAIYNAWCDRVPVMMFAGNGLDAAKRRPGTEWYHSVQDAAAMVRDYVKWDDQPMSLQHFAESAVRGYKIATTAPMEPVLLMADMDLQENPIEHEAELSIPPLSPSIPSQADSAALAEASRMLVSASSPLIIVERGARDQEGLRRLVAFAEALNAPVVDLGARMNFPTTHYLNQTDLRAQLTRAADVILMLDVADPWGQLNTVTDPFHETRRNARKDVKVITLSFSDVYLKSNYQDFQRFLPVNLAITGDVQASLPAFTEQVRRAADGSLRQALSARSADLRKAHEDMRRRARDAAAIGWNLSPVSTARLAAEVWEAVRNEPWSLVVSDRITWARRLWPATEYHQMLGGSGGQGVGYSLPGAIGAALANRDKGLFSVTFQPDGDLMYGPGALWTAAHHKIPLLFVMHNNRGYFQEVMHLQRMASLHNRRTDQAWIGNAIDNPAIDYAKLAQAHGVWAEGPITDPGQLGPALRRAVEVVKRGAPALIDVVCQAR